MSRILHVRLDLLAIYNAFENARKLSNYFRTNEILKEKLLLTVCKWFLAKIDAEMKAMLLKSQSVSPRVLRMKARLNALRYTYTSSNGDGIFASI